jgi:hypothetical protein
MKFINLIPTTVIPSSAFCSKTQQTTLREPNLYSQKGPCNEAEFQLHEAISKTNSRFLIGNQIKAESKESGSLTLLHTLTHTNRKETKNRSAL